jgi:hypothetical protein
VQQTRIGGGEQLAEDRILLVSGALDRVIAAPLGAQRSRSRIELAAAQLILEDRQRDTGAERAVVAERRFARESSPRGLRIAQHTIESLSRSFDFRVLHRSDRPTFTGLTRGLAAAATVCEAEPTPLNFGFREEFRDSSTAPRGVTFLSIREALAAHAGIVGDLYCVKHFIPKGTALRAVSDVLHEVRTTIASCTCRQVGRSDILEARLGSEVRVL